MTRYPQPGRRKERFVNHVHLPRIWLDVTIGEAILLMGHDGCGGAPKVVERVTTVEGSGRKPRRVRLLG